MATTDQSPEVSLEAVLDRYDIPLKRKIRCFVPDHDDRIASCSVDLAKNQWFCHACGNGGGPIQALMVLEGLEYAAAVDYAAANGLGGSDPAVRRERGLLRRVPAGTGYKPKYRRHVPAWKRPDK